MGRPKQLMKAYKPVGTINIAEDYHPHVDWTVDPLELDDTLIFIERNFELLTNDEIADIEAYVSSFNEDGEPTLSLEQFAFEIQVALWSKNCG